ncbi:o-succinylbenzoate--CoA ligase [Humibacillus sp. DSM 29435]|uniref:class I adenylate-forming enzyme family protein n=1 Tax=Humibacillus sp. DSM 29435 TaxID=1869167 RepID=UPI000873412D|nr:AMP-binding protein [Humibacillus sp. DSM 29435]OFE14243.1 o-succinylbenzoate--CoA ligase [Humibacillus sp. DSM 29435]
MPSLAEVLARSARRTPDRVAVQFGPETLTYAALDQRVNRLALELEARGLGKGDRMLLVAGNSDAFVVALYAGLRLGAIVVPVNPRSAAPEIDYFVTDSGAKLLLFGPELTQNIQAWRDLPDRTGDLPALALGAAPGFDDVLASSLHQLADPVDVEVREDDDALIIYTSGTTGKPKGALFDQHRVLWVGINTAFGLGLREGERMLHVAPLYHSAALNMLLIGGMSYGATHVILPAFDPEKVLETLERERITMFFGVPTMYTFLLRSPSIGTRDLSSLRVCMYGAAPMPATTAQAIVAALPGATVIQACGLTEGGPGGILLQHDEVLAQPSASGRTAIPNTEVRIVDLDDHDVPPGGVGEMLLRGETVMKGYWGKPEATEEATRDGWLHTGDLALIDADGYITIVDRMKDMIITGGRNVYSAEVESALAGHPAVGDITIIGRPSDDYGETVVAVVTPRDGATITLEELREFGKPLLSPHKLPRDLVLAEIPRNPSGKILKHRVRAAVGG